MFDIAARACQAGTNAVFAEPISPKIFYMAGDIESWGRGIDKMRMGLSAAHLPEPTFKEHCGGLLVTIQIGELANKLYNGGTANDTKGDTINDTKDDTQDDTQKITSCQTEILNLMWQDIHVSVWGST